MRWRQPFGIDDLINWPASLDRRRAHEFYRLWRDPVMATALYAGMCADQIERARLAEQLGDELAARVAALDRAVPVGACVVRDCGSHDGEAGLTARPHGATT